MIPFENQLKTNDATFAYVGDIDLSNVTTMYLVSKNEEYEFKNKEELIAKYKELTNNLEK